MLDDQGYAPTTVCRHLRLVMQVSRRLEADGLRREALTPDLVEAFVPESFRHVLRQLLSYLRTVGVESPTEPMTALEDLLQRYRQYLLGERSLAAVTVRGYLDTAKRFLQARCGGDPRRLAGLDAADVSGFVASEAARGLSPRTINEAVVDLRSLLRFLYLRGLIDAPLAQATPWMANARAGSLPRSLDRSVAHRLLDSCDPHTLVGSRDLAMLTMLCRLGLRAAEVAAVHLDDIDWRAGEVVVHGKGGITDRLPLPSDVGQALAEYLWRRGPAPGCRQVFLHVNAPRDGVQATDVRAVVRRACERAGLDDLGTHRFRHALATEMLARGAPLHEIGQLLRHRDHKTTAAYASVDFAALGMLARPWPGSRS